MTKQAMFLLEFTIFKGFPQSHMSNGMMSQYNVHLPDPSFLDSLLGNVCSSKS